MKDYDKAMWVSAKIVIKETQTEVYDVVPNTLICYDDLLISDMERVINEGLKGCRHKIERIFGFGKPFAFRVCIKFDEVSIYKDGELSTLACSDFTFDDPDYSCLKRECALLHDGLENGTIYSMIENKEINCAMFYKDDTYMLLKKSKPDFYNMTVKHITPMLAKVDVLRDGKSVRGTCANKGKEYYIGVYPYMVDYTGDRNIIEVSLPYFYNDALGYCKDVIEDNDLIITTFFIFGTPYTFNASAKYYRENFDAVIKYATDTFNKVMKR